MARSDLLINLVKAGVNGDTGTFRRTVDAIVAEERGKQHNVLADQIERVVKTTNGNALITAPRPASEGSQRAKDFISEIMPRRKLIDLTLPETTQLATRQLIEEQQRASLLRSHSLEPRHRVLLVGPPGNGKTTLAEAIAESLAVPLWVVRYEGMIGSFLGETASRLKRVFEYARTTPCVLFFDEFDAVGKERGDKHETGEIKRVVTSLLMQIDELPSYVVVIAATNHSELLDRAVWRRFQLRLPLPAPTQKQLTQFVQSLAEKAELNLGVSAAQITKSLGRVSYAEAEEFLLNIMRRVILTQGERPSGEIVREQLKLWTARARSAKEGTGEEKSAGTSTS
ncbi:AAA+ superfamily predicted ATPase [Afipia massiliensis]|uniref:AAA+ superfamily predicted ATPase n=1 Tax=Afipia massiliensis TaxID=211460 RepID=A0A840MY03_9BRAD|nr:ATP-binding protein [Afipia massiliensis]MBB5052715.1 AAA+ superfamily predicted ATPase [Afipia massiliensis]